MIVDAKELGFDIVPAEARELAELGVKITAAANQQLGFCHPLNPDWKHLSFCQFAGPLVKQNGTWTGPNAVVVRPGKIDRSPTGTGCSARMAVCTPVAKWRPPIDTMPRSIIGSEFECGIDSTTSVGEKPAIVPTISGRAWITGSASADA